MTEATAEKPQHLTALERANAVRMARAQVKRDVRMGTVDVRDVLRDPPECLRSLRGAVSVTELLSWQPRWGLKRSRRFLNGLHVGAFVSPFDLTPARREQIARRLG